MESSPPADHSTNPPRKLRQAEPLASRASRAWCKRSGTCRGPAASAWQAATVKAQNPLAEEAMPALAGKLLRLSTRAGQSTPTAVRMRSRWLTVRRWTGPDCSWPSMTTMSASQAVPSIHATVVVEWAWLNVMLSDPLVGRFRFASTTPQYLTKAMLACARQVALHRYKVGLGVAAMSVGCQARPSGAARTVGFSRQTAWTARL